MFFKTILVVFLLISFLKADELVKVGVLAKRGSDITLARWSSTIEYLDKSIDGYSFEIVPLSFEDLKNSVAKGEVDFFLTNTMYYVELEYLYGASRIATLKNRSSKGDGLTSFGGVIFVRDESKIKKYSDIKGKSFGAVDISSFGGWVMAQKEFKDNSIESDDFSSFKFFGSHDNVVKAVLDKRIDAGTVKTDTLERMADEGLIRLKDLRIIGEKKYKGFPFLVSTALYPEWPFAKVSKTSEKLANKVLTALLSIEPKSKVLKDSNLSGWTIPLDYSKVHKVLEELHIGPYKKFGKLTFQGSMMNTSGSFIVW